MEVLIQGIEFTNQLQLLLLQNMNVLFGDGESDLQEYAALDLTTKIHQSFTDAISLLNTTNVSGDVGTLIVSPDEVLIRDNESTLSPVITGISSFSNSDDWKSSCDSKVIPGSSTDRKIGSKRRKTTLLTWAKVTPVPVHDGHAWRKYGQKEIHHTEFPRSYYRCTYRNEQGCQATKQVQKTQDKPSMYQTTYKGQHTCKATSSFLDAIPDHLMLDESEDSACVINFQTNLTTEQPPYTFSSSSSSFSNISVHKPEVVKNNTTSHDQYPLGDISTPITDDNDLTMSEFLLLADLSAFDSISREVFDVMGVQQAS